MVAYGEEVIDSCMDILPEATSLRKYLPFSQQTLAVGRFLGRTGPSEPLYNLLNLFAHLFLLENS